MYKQRENMQRKRDVASGSILSTDIMLKNGQLCNELYAKLAWDDIFFVIISNDLEVFAFLRRSH
jgi:hypothetical protein